MEGSMGVLESMYGGGEGEQTSGVIRTAPDVPAEVKANVGQWCKRIKHAKGLYKDDFDRMRSDMEYARLCADKTWVQNENYVAPLVQRILKQSVSALYAKNPKAEAKRRPRLEYRVWSGDPMELQEAMQSVAAAMTQMGMVQPDPNAMALLKDVEEAKQRKRLYDRVGKSLEILFDYYTSEQEPSFKRQMKQLVRRVKTCGVGYLDLGFQRIMDPQPDITAKINDTRDAIQTAERIQKDILDGEVVEGSAEIDELNRTLAALQEQDAVILREGPIFGFPWATQVILDPKTRQLEGLVGTGWLAVETSMSPEMVQETYNVDVRGAFTAHTVDERSRRFEEAGFGGGSDLADEKSKGMVCVWRVQNKKNGTIFTIADGYPGYLKAPTAPSVKVERFFTLFPLIFNELEAEDTLFPFSDVHYLRPMQDEINRSRQGLREHKQANRPAYATARGKLEDEDKTNLRDRPANAIIELSALAPGESVETLLQPIRPVGIDPNVYETNPVFEDILRSTGAQEANLGSTAGNSATESAIAESSRVSTVDADADTLDDFLSDVAKATGEVMLLELNRETVEEIVGPGAVWPEMTREEIVKEVYLKVKAGSSGKPNKAAELANLERGMPMILQMPNINPIPLGRRYVDLLDIDAEEAIVEGLPSITAINAMAGRQIQQAQPGENDPNAQGARGADNSPQPTQNEEGPQAQFPQSPDDSYMMQ